MSLSDILIQKLLQENKHMWQMTGENRFGINRSDAGHYEKCPGCKKDVSLMHPRKGSGESQINVCNNKRCKTQIVVIDDD